MLYMGESTTPFDPRGRTRGKPSQLLLDNYKYLEYLYKIRFGFISRPRQLLKYLEASRFRSDVKLPNDFACF